MSELVKELEALDAKATKAPWVITADSAMGRDEAWCYWHTVGPLELMGIGELATDDEGVVIALRNALPALIEYVKAAQALRSPFVGNGRESTDWAFNIVAAVRKLDAAEAALLAALRGGK